MKLCGDYVGVVCIDGTCPRANKDEYAERGMDVIKNCNECPYYKGCEDCYFFDNGKCGVERVAVK